MGDAGQWLLVATEIGLVVYALFTAATILLERRRPTATLSWLLILVLIPIVGLAAYWLIGRRKVRRSRRARRRRRLHPTQATASLATLHESPEHIGPQLRGLIRLALERSAAPLRRAGEVQLLPVPGEGGDAAWTAMEAAIRGARHRIHAQFYIWRNDATGERMIQLLAERARAGVRVRLLYDDFGSISTPLRHFRVLEQAGGTVARFGPLRLRLARSRTRVDFRNHRKMLTIDGEVGFFGGLNVADEYRGTTRSGRVWNDLFVRMTGDAVLGLEAVFIEDWLSATDELIEIWSNLPELEVERLGAGQSMVTQPSTPMRSVGPLVQVVPSGPDQRPSKLGDDNASVLAAQFIAAIGSALERVWIATPYFVPDDALAQVLAATALRGVDVQVVVPNLADNDSRLVGLAARSYYDALMDAGCRIFEYRPGMLHAKYMIIDETVAVMGSANFDVRSLYLDYEVTTLFYDRLVAQHLAELFERDRSQSDAVDPQSRADLALGERLSEAGARLLSPLL